MPETNPYQLDAHGEMLMSQYHERINVFKRMEMLVSEHLHRVIREQNIFVNAIEHRLKTEQSLAGKLELKGAKYRSLEDVTDILGVRVITFYTDDVDKVAAIVKQSFDIDWDNSVDKRKLHQLDSFGYNSLHYICRLPKSFIDDPECPELNEYRFELQMRTALQHVWSAIEHDNGYKGAVEIPKEYIRQFSRLAGMLELVDDEFSRLRTTLTEYRRRIQALVASGKLEQIPLTVENFRSYLSLRPFDRLNQRIAAVNQAEIYPSSMMPFLPLLQQEGMETLGDVEQFIQENEDDAYLLALSQIAVTDYDILSETIGILNLCIVHILKKGGRKEDLLRVFETTAGKQDAHEMLVDSIMKCVESLPFMRK